MDLVCGESVINGATLSSFLCGRVQAVTDSKHAVMFMEVIAKESIGQGALASSRSYHKNNLWGGQIRKDWLFPHHRIELKQKKA